MLFPLNSVRDKWYPSTPPEKHVSPTKTPKSSLLGVRELVITIIRYVPKSNILAFEARVSWTEETTQAEMERQGKGKEAEHFAHPTPGKTLHLTL